MPKIITITFSPCIDKSTSVSAVFPEKKMRCKIPKYEPGGGGINVARAIIKLGGEATALYSSGGDTGKVFNDLVKHENIPSIIIETVNETRENITVFDESANNQYRFGMPPTALTEKEWEQFIAKVKEIDDVEYIIASGSLPAEVPVNVYGLLAECANKRNAKFIVDTTGVHLRQALDAGVYLIKPNLAELTLLTGKSKLTLPEARDTALDILANSKCEVIVISLGAAGAMFVTTKLAKLIKPPQVISKSTIGAGDSMVAGIVYYLSKGKSLLEAVQYGVACGTAATLNPGTELCRKEDADELVQLLYLSEID